MLFLLLWLQWRYATVVVRRVQPWDLSKCGPAEDIETLVYARTMHNAVHHLAPKAHSIVRQQNDRINYRPCWDQSI